MMGDLGQRSATWPVWAVTLRGIWFEGVNQKGQRAWPEFLGELVKSVRNVAGERNGLRH